MKACQIIKIYVINLGQEVSLNKTMFRKVGSALQGHGRLLYWLIQG